MSSAPSTTPTEDTIRSRLTAALSPTSLAIRNDSAAHAHHAAMASYAERTGAVRETHFHVAIVSEAFAGKMQAARHRMVYGLLADELRREGGVHALQLKTRTPDEEEAARDREAAEKS